MARIVKLIVLIIIASIAGLLTIYIANWVIEPIKDYTAKATIVAATITVLGVIFSAMYNEISSYYKDRSANIGKRWELIYPLVKKHYFPWISLAKSLHRDIQRVMNEDSVGRNDQSQLLYLITLFYGYRLKFLIEDGGLILLSSSKEEDKVEEAYHQIEKALNWEGDKTPRRVSYLQNLFISKSKKNNPYVLDTFLDDLSHDPNLQQMLDTFGQWLNKENMQNVDISLQKFITTFKSSIDKLYSAWET